MKTKFHRLLVVLALLAGVYCVEAQGTAFTYQGRLNDGGAPANGYYDLQFILFSTDQFGFPAAPILTNAAVPVSNGLFTTILDFGDGIFTGTNFWIEIGVRTNGGDAFVTLAPRQPITPTPYAITAEGLSSVVENNLIQAGVSLGTISGGGGNSIQSGANFSTVGGGGNNVIQSGADHSTIGGGSGNNIAPGAWESFVGGGQNNYIYSHWSAIGGGLFNSIFTNADYSFIGGGYVNQIQMNASYSAIGGGYFNIIQTNASYSAIAGGIQNIIQMNASYSTIGGGNGNQIQNNSIYSTISGGWDNTLSGLYSFIGGGIDNTIQTNAGVATIAGGDQNTIQSDSYYSTISGGDVNTIQVGSYKSVIAGGEDNTIQPNSPYSTISGGLANVIQTNTEFSTIGGGAGNTIQTNASVSVIAGGSNNTIQTNSQYAAISGGSANIIHGNATAPAIGGGEFNEVFGSFASVPGGNANHASGDYSFAAGHQAQALHQGAFVWADAQGTPFSSTANNQFLIRAAGGVGVNTASPQQALSVVGGMSIDQGDQNSGNDSANALTFGSISGEGIASQRTAGTGKFDLVFYTAFLPRVTILADGYMGIGNTSPGSLLVVGTGGAYCNGTTWVNGSDRNSKEDFAAINPREVLEKVSAMPITEWQYKVESDGVKHIGPMAQDFHAAFDLNGADDKHISTVDEGGVALAAIQGLNQKVEEKDAEIQELKQRLAALEKIVLNKKLN